MTETELTADSLLALAPPGPRAGVRDDERGGLPHGRGSPGSATVASGSRQSGSEQTGLRLDPASLQWRERVGGG